MFVCITSYRGELPTDDPILVDHWAFLDAEFERGSIVASGPQQPRVGGVMLLRVPHEPAAHELMHRDPLVRHERIDYRLVQFQPTRALTPELLE